MSYDFTPAEMSDRLGRIRERMATDQLDAMISTDAASVLYATGFRGEPRTLLVLPDEVVLYTSFRTLPWAREQTREVELSTCADPIDDIRRRLTPRSKIGVD